MNSAPSGGERERLWDVPGLTEYHGQDIFLTEALTRKALAALETPATARQPLFLYMSHYAVHTPIEPDRRFRQKYLDAGLDPTEASYAAMVEGMDRSLGDILDFLDSKEIARQTVVLFMSDNGGLSAHARGGKPHTHNLPLSSGKGSEVYGRTSTISGLLSLVTHSLQVDRRGYGLGSV